MDLRNWTVLDVAAALERNGYTASDLIDVEFLYMNDRGQAVFDVSYEDDEFGDVGHGRVFIGFNKNGVLVGDY